MRMHDILVKIRYRKNIDKYNCKGYFLILNYFKIPDGIFSLFLYFHGINLT